MKNIKLTIVYYSMTGTNFQLATWAKDEAEKEGAQVRMVKVQELAPEEVIQNNPTWKAQVEKEKDVKIATSEDLTWADAIIFSSPTRFGNIASQMSQFMAVQGSVWAEGKLVNKVVSAMSSAQNPHGGQEQTIHAIYTTMMHWGAIIVPPGYTDDSIYLAGGNPYGTSVTAGANGMVEDVEKSVRHQTKRTLKIANLLKLGQNK